MKEALIELERQERLCRNGGREGWKGPPRPSGVSQQGRAGADGTFSVLGGERGIGRRADWSSFCGPARWISLREPWSEPSLGLKLSLWGGVGGY